MDVVYAGILYIYLMYFSIAVTAGDGEEEECNFCAWYACNPTIVGIEESKFNPKKDAKTIKNAIGIFFIEKDKIVNILTERTEKQRKTIVSTYSDLFDGHRLKEDVFDTTYGSVSVVMQDLVTPISRFYARYLNKAVNDKDIILMTEIFTILPPCAIQQVHKQYEDVYKKNLNIDITTSLSVLYPVQNVVELILLLAKGNRLPPTDERWTKSWNKKIENDVKELVRALQQDKWEDKTNVVRQLLAERTLPEVQDIITNYEKRKGSLEDGITNARFERAQVIYLTIIDIARNQPEYFAKKLQKILHRRHMISVNREDLNYVIVGRSRVDLADIKTAFLEKYKSNLYVTILNKITLKFNDYYIAILHLVKTD